MTFSSADTNESVLSAAWTLDLTLPLCLVVILRHVRSRVPVSAKDSDERTREREWKRSCLIGSAVLGCSIPLHLPKLSVSHTHAIPFSCREKKCFLICLKITLHPHLTPVTSSFPCTFGLIVDGNTARQRNSTPPPSDKWTFKKASLSGMRGGRRYFGDKWRKNTLNVKETNDQSDLKGKGVGWSRRRKATEVGIPCEVLNITCKLYHLCFLF